MKTFEQHNNKEAYYAIRWLNLNSNKFDGELEGHYKSFNEIMTYLFDINEHDIEMYNVEFKVVKVEETEVSKDDANLWLETQKYNI